MDLAHGAMAVAAFSRTIRAHTRRLSIKDPNCYNRVGSVEASCCISKPWSGESEVSLVGVSLVGDLAPSKFIVIFCVDVFILVVVSKDWWPSAC